LHARLVEVVAGRASPEAFAAALAPLLSAHTLPAEHELVRNTPRVTRVTHSFNERQRGALERCVRIMCRGMPWFQRNSSLRGLADLQELDSYCYHVAGVVGEMLTELFCDHSPAIERQREALSSLAVSFGQGLQMTNILKDVWDDRACGACWLPRPVFERQGLDLAEPGPVPGGAFEEGLRQLIAIAHGHLRNALAYTLRLPRRETGIRRFCLWAIGMAVLTLRNINRRRDFTTGAKVKISRRTVRATILLANLATRSNTVLRLLFKAAARGLPLQEPAPSRHAAAGAAPLSPPLGDRA
ncbi:MAG: squalene/phytoene synthase family protein, partial [Planctomycetota bacterium]